MNDLLASLHALNSVVGTNSCTEQQRLIELIDHLSSDENLHICVAFVIDELEKCSTQQNLTDLQNSTAYFVCCRSIETYLRTPLTTRPVSSVEIQKMSDFLRKWVKCFVAVAGGRAQSTILKRKVAQTICLAVIRYYPNTWPSVFDEMLILFSELNVQNLRPPLTKTNPMLLCLLDIFLEVLQELDSFILNRDAQRSPEEVAQANLIKDSMRVTCLPAIVQMIIIVVKGLDTSLQREVEILCFSLQIIGLYVSWIDINLVVNEVFFAILRTLVQLTDPNLLRSVCVLLKGFVSKGMAAFPDKLSLILGLWSELLQPIINSANVAKVLTCDAITSNSSFENDSDDIVNFLQEFSSLFGSIGYNIVEAYRGLLSSNSSVESNTVNTSVFSQATSSLQTAVDQCLEKLETTIDISIKLLAYPDSDVSQGVVMFIGDYLGLLKNSLAENTIAKQRSKAVVANGTMNANGVPEKNKILIELTPCRMFKLERLLHVLVDKLKYPEDETADEMDFVEDRHEYMVIVRNIARIDGCLVLNAVQSLLQQILLQLPASMRAQDVSGDILARLEACLFLFFSLGEFYKAPRNDHFAPAYSHSAKMTEIMMTICSSGVASIDYYPVQLDFFEIIGRYDKFFNSSPKLIFEVLTAFLDERGLRNPNVKVRCRCAYLFSRLIKSHKTVLAPHAEQILQQLGSLLPLDTTPELPAGKVTNGAPKSSTAKSSDGVSYGGGGFLSITEQSFLYESSAHLILARGSVSSLQSGENSPDVASEDPRQTAQLFALLLHPILLQFPQLIRLMAQEKDPEMAEARGNIVKLAADLITRTTRVMSSQTPPPTAFVHIFMEILNVMVGSLTYLPSNSGAPGRSAACVGIRAFLHRLIGAVGPDCDVAVKTGGDDSSTTTASNCLLLAISSATPQLIDYGGVNSSDQDVRWRDLREHMPLFSQVASRYNDRAIPFLSECLPPLIGSTLSALSEPLHESQLVAIEERKSLRRGLLQMLHGFGQVLPQGILVALGGDAANILSSIVSLTEACLEADDPVGLKLAFGFFVDSVTHFVSDESFYKEFVLPRLLPLAFLTPARPTFRLADAQFALALNEAATCVYTINAAKGVVFQEFLENTFLPQQNLSPEYISVYMNSLRTVNLQGFQAFAKSVKSHIRQLFKWLQTYHTLSRRNLRECSKLLYDVQVMKELVRLFEEFSSPDEIHSVCRLFYDSYTSGDKKVKLLVTLLLPSMLHAYLVQSNNKSITEKHDSSVSTHVSFSLGEKPKPPPSIDSLTFLLAELCHLAPACIRCPTEGIRSARFSRVPPDLKINSIYHTGNRQYTPMKAKITPTLPDRLGCVDGIGEEADGSNHSQFTSLYPDIACVIRIYTDTVMRQLIDGTQEQQGVLLSSIETFCSLVQYATSLQSGQRILRSVNDFLIDLVIAIDKILLFLLFDGELRGISDAANVKPSLRSRVFDLLPAMERYASYHCLVSVLLIISAVKSTWAMRIKRPHHHNMIPIRRRVRLISEEPLNSVGSSDSDSEAPTAPVPAVHKASVFTNANFRAEPVAEDIPMNSVPEETSEKKLQHRHLHHGLHLSKFLTRSSENLSGEAKNVRLVKLPQDRTEKD